MQEDRAGKDAAVAISKDEDAVDPEKVSADSPRAHVSTSSLCAL